MSPLLQAALSKCKQSPDTRWGICKNVADFVRASDIDYKTKAEALLRVTVELGKLMSAWPDKAVDKSQSHAVYPVEGNPRIYDRHQAEGILWQNPRRIALLDWLLEQQQCESQQ